MNPYVDAIETLGKLATVAVIETAVIGIYVGYSLCNVVNKHKEAKAEKKHN